MCYEINYIVSGKGYFYTNECLHAVREGDIYINLPGEIHRWSADNVEHLRMFYIGFNFSSYSDGQNPFINLQKAFDSIKSPICKDRLDIQVPFINIFKELMYKSEYSSLMIKTYLHQIIMMVYRNFFDLKENRYLPENSMDNNNKKLVYRIISFVDSNMLRIDKLSEIEKELRYSYSYLSHLFSRETGMSMYQYYNNKRIEYAVELLINDNINVSEIASKLQYQSVHSFSKAFCKSMGVPPLAYRSLHKLKTG